MPERAAGLVPRGERKARRHGARLRLGRAGAQESTVGRVQSLADRGDLLDRFAFTEYDFGVTLTQAPVVIEDCESQILGRKVAQSCQRFLGRLLPGRDIGQQGLEARAIHAAVATGSRYS